MLRTTVITIAKPSIVATGTQNCSNSDDRKNGIAKKTAPPVTMENDNT